jgi:putative tryptophan/tyrosine transport system substrate-binding protein
VRLRVDVIVASSSSAVLAAKRATKTIPIVMTNTADPVGTGLVASLAHPGGNVTGLTTLSAELSAKRLELLREVVPKAGRIAVLWDAANPAVSGAVRATESAGRSLGVQIFISSAGRADEIESVFSGMVRERVQGVVAMPGPIFLVERRHLSEIALKYRLPVVFPQREYVESGGLMAYGSSLSDLFARAAQFVDRIVKGARSADLPVEQPTKFELIINLKTAKALGLTIPQSLLLRADQVIE